MERIVSFSGFRAIYESSTQYPNIIIGDSSVPLLAPLFKNVKMLGNFGSEEVLWKSGMGLGWLKNAVNKFSVSPTVKNVIVSIGTNGGFNSRDDIKGLFQSLKRIFPNAKFLAIQGSWGWGNNRTVREDQVKSYYQKFAEQGAIVVDPPIGFVENDSKAHSRLPTHHQIAKTVNSIVSGGISSVVPATVAGEKTFVQSTQDSPPDVKKFQSWLDQNKPGWAWGYPGGVVGKLSGYGIFGPRTTRAWSLYKDEYKKSKF